MKKVKISALRPKSVAEVLALGMAFIPVAIPLKGTFRVDLSRLTGQKNKYVVIYSGDNVESITAINLQSNEIINSGDQVDHGTAIEVRAIPQDKDDDIESEWNVNQTVVDINPDDDDIAREVPTLPHTDKDYLIAELNQINKESVLDGTIPVSVGPITYCITLRDLVETLTSAKPEEIPMFLFRYGGENAESITVINNIDNSEVPNNSLVKSGTPVTVTAVPEDKDDDISAVWMLNNEPV